MFYLTVHDIVWVNELICGAGVPFDYELLEACMAAQYGYGDSRDVLGQAGAFAEKMIRTVPFREGNLRTGLVCVTMFLTGNRLSLEPDASRLLEVARAVQAGASEGEDLVAALRGRFGSQTPQEAAVNAGRPPAVRSLASQALARLGPVLDACAEEDGPVPGWTASPYLHRD